ncbi:MAG: hypothetical protein ACJA2S_001827 [Cyclobacteriaceae bacterium]|jgi:hypothetical protein
MQIPQLFNIKPHNEIARLYLTQGGSSRHINITFKFKHIVLRMLDEEQIDDFNKGVSRDWVQFAIENSNSILLDEEKIMDEFVFNLN